MKSRVALFLLAALILLAAILLAAQEKSVITVKNSEVSNGVLIVDVTRAGKSYELQCNHGVTTCAPLKSGKYQMVELPSNTGMYDCRDVQVFPESANPETDQKLGEYCLIEK